MDREQICSKKWESVCMIVADINIDDGRSLFSEDRLWAGPWAVCLPPTTALGFPSDQIQLKWSVSS